MIKPSCLTHTARPQALGESASIRRRESAICSPGRSRRPAPLTDSFPSPGPLSRRPAPLPGPSAFQPPYSPHRPALPPPSSPHPPASLSAARLPSGASKPASRPASLTCAPDVPPHSRARPPPRPRHGPASLLAPLVARRPGPRQLTRLAPARGLWFLFLSPQPGGGGRPRRAALTRNC